MYVLIVVFVISLFIFYSFGSKFTQLIDADNKKNYSFFDDYFIGLCIVGSVVNIWSIFLPTNIFLTIILLIFSIIFSKNKFQKINYSSTLAYLKQNKTQTGFYLLITFIIIIIGITLPRQYDSLLYHISAVQWNEKFRAIPGLANLHDRFGFNSSIFTLNAAFSYSLLYNQMFFIVNSLSYYIFLLWLTNNLFRFKNILSFFSVIFIYFFTEQYIFDISSPGSDILINIFIAYLVFTFLYFENSIVNKKLLFIVLPLFGITLKVSIIPILILTLYILLSTNRNIFKKIILISFLIIFPWVIRNLIISGYILFPFEKIDLFSFDWKVPKEKVIDTKNWIYSWARIPYKDQSEVLSLTFYEWFKIWWNAALLKNKIFFTIALVSPLILLFELLKKNKTKVYIVVLTLYSSFLLWLFTAPDFRFLFSVILSLNVIFLTYIFSHFKFIIKNMTIKTITLSLFLGFFLYDFYGKSMVLFKEDYKKMEVNEYLYLPKDFYYSKFIKKIKYTKKIIKSNNGLSIEIYETSPKHSQCYDKFPCSPDISKNLQLRGEKIIDGFKN